MVTEGESMNSWGLELTIDGYTNNVDRVTDKENISSFVEQLVTDIDMISYGPLWIERFATHDEAKAGISFVQMIETSNITGHFVERTGDLYLNCFSCKDFSPSIVIDLICKWFDTDPKKLIVKVTQRQAPKHD